MKTPYVLLTLLIALSCSHQKKTPKAEVMAAEPTSTALTCIEDLEYLHHMYDGVIEGTLEKAQDGRSKCALMVEKENNEVSYLVIINSQKGLALRKIAGNSGKKISEKCETRLSGSQEVTNFLSVSFGKPKETMLQIEIENGLIRKFYGTAWDKRPFVCNIKTQRS